MKLTTYSCSRCQEMITAGLAELTCACGMLRRHVPDGIELCEPCQHEFLRWLAEPARSQVALQPAGASA